MECEELVESVGVVERRGWCALWKEETFHSTRQGKGGGSIMDVACERRAQNERDNDVTESETTEKEEEIGRLFDRCTDPRSRDELKELLRQRIRREGGASSCLSLLVLTAVQRAEPEAAEFASKGIVALFDSSAWVVIYEDVQRLLWWVVDQKASLSCAVDEGSLAAKCVQRVLEILEDCLDDNRDRMIAIISDCFLSVLRTIIHCLSPSIPKLRAFSFFLCLSISLSVSHSRFQSTERCAAIQVMESIFFSHPLTLMEELLQQHDLQDELVEACRLYGLSLSFFLSFSLLQHVTTLSLTRGMAETAMQRTLQRIAEWGMQTEVALRGWTSQEIAKRIEEMVLFLQQRNSLEDRREQARMIVCAHETITKLLSTSFFSTDEDGSWMAPSPSFPSPSAPASVVCLESTSGREEDKGKGHNL